ncbi:hypothetical protein [Burkholderia guangdongensis]|uniref:hypothetical protein n=1 Tax=Burkholderia guangdongensis TaxID=1792500 RepID=UPI0015CB825B|nr:hypothetical protein [Burkholderia guangdongensis]
MTDTKTVITQHLAVLLGLELSGINHAADMLTLQFGQLRQITTRRGTVKQVGAWALHVQCGWRVEQSGRIVASQDDLGTDDAARRTTERLDGLLVDPIPAVVERVQANASGGIWIDLSHDRRLVVTPNDVAEDEDWRFFAPDSDGPHFVIEGGKIDPDSLPSSGASDEKQS